LATFGSRHLICLKWLLEGGGISRKILNFISAIIRGQLALKKQLKKIGANYG
jgi:hypothetical protein